MSEQVGQPKVYAGHPERYAGEAARWTPSPTAARAVGVTPAHVRRAVLGHRDRPPLATRPWRARSVLVQPGALFDWCREHAAACPGLRPPPGYVPAEGICAPSIEPPAADGIELHELLVRQVLSGAPSDQIRATAAATSALRGKRLLELKEAKALPPADVVALMRSCGSLWVEAVDDGAADLAAVLIKTLRERFSVDLEERNPAAAAVLESVVREAYGAGVVARVQANVEEQLAGQGLLTP